MGWKDCECLAAQMVRVIMERRYAAVSLGHYDERAEFDRVHALVGGELHFSSGTDEYPSGWMAIDVTRAGMRITAQRFATDEEREQATAGLLPVVVEEMAF